MAAHVPSAAAPPPPHPVAVPHPCTHAAKEAAEDTVLASCKAADFEVLERLGGGDNGDVLLVRCIAAGHPFPHKLYALKVVKNYDELSSGGLRINFAEEFELFKRLKPHSCLVRHRVKFVDALAPPMLTLLIEADAVIAGQAAACPQGLYTMFALFDFHPVSLEGLLGGMRAAGVRVLPQADFVLKARQLFQGLLLLEANNILHLDVKLANVLVKEDGCVCLCDLGEALVLPDGERVVRLVAAPAGNPAHRAPEVTAACARFGRILPVGGVEVDFSGQAVFEMGVLLWELAVGWHPIRGYPARPGYTPADVCILAPTVLAALEREGYPAAKLVDLVRQMVACEAGERPSLAVAAGRFELLFDPKLAAAHAAVAAAEGARAVAVAEAQAALAREVAAREEAVRAQVRAEERQAAAEARAAAAEAERDEARVRAEMVEAANRMLVSRLFQLSAAPADAISEGTAPVMVVPASPDACEVYCRAVTASFAHVDTHRVVVSIMKAHPTHASVQEWGCGALSVTGRGSAIKSSGGLEQVYAAMEGHFALAGVQEAACGALRIMATLVDNSVRIVSSGGLERMFAAMDRHLESAGVQEAACGVLGNLVVKYENGARIVALGGLERVYAAMKVHFTSARVQEAACGALAKLALYRDNKVQIVSSGGLECVVAAMQGHLASEGVQEAACNALRCLTASADTVAKILSSGGLELVYAAMDGYAASAAVQEAACGTLSNLVVIAYNEGRTFTMSSGGLERIYAAMYGHLASVDVQNIACITLGNLAVYADSAIGMVATGALERLYAAMVGHSTSAAVQVAACEALSRLTLHADISERIISSGGLVRVYAAMEGHVTSAAVQVAACEALWRLAVNVDNVERIVSSGGLVRVYAAMEGHLASAGVQRAASAALGNLARTLDNRTHIVSSGGLERLYAAMDRHLASEGLQQAACGALRNLAGADANAASGFGGWLFAAVRGAAPAGVPEVGRARMVGDGHAVRLLRGAQAAHPYSTNIQQYARDALAKLV